MDELRDLADLFGILSEKPSRGRWVNWIVWTIAALGVLVTVAAIVLTATSWLFGWPPA